ncbi:type II secretion system protein [Candidatus Saccharibacteria bacterium]|nr:type II secretion system protein [Candidatus Saccharibacteria bacterium]
MSKPLRKQLVQGIPRRHSATGGYTIIEVMIFLAVTGVLLVSALYVFSGRQGRTQFTQGVQEASSKIRDVMNEVSSGYFQSNGDFTCQASASGPTFPSGQQTNLGQNTDCIFIGKIVQLGPLQDACDASGQNLSNCNDYTVFTIVGLRQTTTVNGKQEVTSLAAAKPVLPHTNPNLSYTNELPWQIHATSMWAVYDDTVTPIGAFGFVTTFPGAGGNDDLVSGSQSFDLITVANTSLGESNDTIASRVSDAATFNDTLRSPNQVIICLESGTTSPARPAAITIGGSGRQLSTETFFDAAVPEVCNS